MDMKEHLQNVIDSASEVIIAIPKRKLTTHETQSSESEKTLICNHTVEFYLQHKKGERKTMVDFSFTEEQELFRKATREWAPKMATTRSRTRNG
jgi:hypothetical protein